MLNSAVLDVVIGMVFCYATVALVSSSIYEGVASLLKLRARTLLGGIKDLLNDKELTSLASSIYKNALVNPRCDGQALKGRRPEVLPSYIEPKAFAIALIQEVQKDSQGAAGLESAIERVQNSQVKELLRGMYVRADGKIEHMQAEIEAWFDRGMERVSGAYKRGASLFTFVIALAIAVLLNIDTIHLFRTLWTHPALVAQSSTLSAQNVESALQQLRVLPVGWANWPSSLPLAFCGWLLTASSAIFGAPFWFDLLKRLSNVRGTGRSPDEKKRP
jgi:hypothetical protein